MRKLISLLSILCLCTLTDAYAQSRADVFNPSVEITWLGLDFSQVRFIVPVTGAEVSAADMKDRYVPSWNQLFITEPKKFDVAGAVHRKTVHYATEVTAEANKKADADKFFSDALADYSLLDEEKVSRLVSRYDFGKNTGIGLLFFVEGMSKEKEEAAVWVTFVDMGTKKVLLARREAGKAGGFGFRNYWAKPHAEILKTMKGSFKKWSR